MDTSAERRCGVSAILSWVGGVMTGVDRDVRGGWWCAADGLA